MSSSWKNCLLMTFIAIPLLILTTLSLGGTIVVGVIGIIKAETFCLSSNDSENCFLQMIINNESSQRAVIKGENENEFTYWLAGSTGCGLLFAVFATFSLLTLGEILLEIGKTTPSDDTEMESLKDTDGAQLSISSPETELVDIIDGEYLHLLVDDTKVKRRLDCGAFVSLFFSCLFAILALLSLMWAIAVALNRSDRVNITVLPFVIVEFLVAVALPFFLCSSVILASIVLDFVTEGAMDGRNAIPQLLSSVKFKSGLKSKDGTDEDAWIILDSFYFPIKKKTEENRKKHGCCFTCYRSFTTWVLVIIICLSITLSISYFADITLDKQVNVARCDDSRINRLFSCFNAVTLEHVDCIETPDAENLRCFQFYRFGVDVDLITSLSVSFAFYLISSAFFGKIFVVMKILLHLHKTPLWGALFLIVGLVLCVGSIALSIGWITGYASSLIRELPRLNIIILAQIVIVSMFITLVGFLVLIAKWVEKVPRKRKYPNDNKITCATSQNT